MAGQVGGRDGRAGAGREWVNPTPPFTPSQTQHSFVVNIWAQMCKVLCSCLNHMWQELSTLNVCAQMLAGHECCVLCGCATAM